MTKKAQKRLGKSGVRTHDLNSCDIYLIKTQFSMLNISKGRGGAGSGFIPRGALELLLLVIESPSLRFFAQKSYGHFKICKILKKNAEKVKAPGKDRTCIVMIT